MDLLSHCRSHALGCLCMLPKLQRKLQAMRGSKPVSHPATWVANAYQLLLCEASVCGLPRSCILMLLVMTQEPSKDTPQIWRVLLDTALMVLD